MDDDQRLLRFAREMRSDPTLGERILWRALRGRRMGAKVKRQQPIGPFIADFAIFEHRMTIEVDGTSHDAEQLRRDRLRDQWFLDNGWYVLRFSDQEIIDDLDTVLQIIWMAIHDRDSVSDPLNRERW